MKTKKKAFEMTSFNTIHKISLRSKYRAPDSVFLADWIFSQLSGRILYLVAGFDQQPNIRPYSDQDRISGPSLAMIVDPHIIDR